MKKPWLAVAAVLSWVTLEARTLPGLFGNLKAEVKSGSWSDAEKTLDALQTEAAKPGNEEAQRQLASPLAFYRGVCNANLGKKDEAVASFATFLKLQPNATIDASVHSKKAVAAFEAAQKQATERAPSLAEAYKEFPLPADMKDRYPSDRYWGEGPVRWIMTDSEKSAVGPDGSQRVPSSEEA